VSEYNGGIRMIWFFIALGLAIFGVGKYTVDFFTNDYNFLYAVMVLFCLAIAIIMIHFRFGKKKRKHK